MSMWPEPILADTVLLDGRRWQHVRTACSRIDLADEMALEIEECATFLQFDPHETEGYFVLRDRWGKAICVAKISHGWAPEVQGHYGRPATTEEQELADAIADRYGREILRKAGFVVVDEDAASAAPTP